MKKPVPEKRVKKAVPGGVEKGSDLEKHKLDSDWEGFEESKRKEVE